MSISSIFLTHENILSPKRINVNQRDQQSQPPMKATSIIAALLLAPHVAAFAPMRAAKVGDMALRLRYVRTTGRQTVALSSPSPDSVNEPPPPPIEVVPAVAVAAAVEEAQVVDGDAEKTFGSRRLAKMVPPKEMKKLLPLALMFFCVLFNYTILRNTKDVLVVTAPGSGAEVIPFLKTYVQLPGAIAFTVIYSKMCNSMSQDKVFYTTLVPFLAFYASFAFGLYPLRHLIHPHALVAAATAAAPNLAAPLAIVRNWSFSAFYLFAELWGSVVLSVLFWGQANAVMNVREAKKYYPLFGIGANVALLFAGQVMKGASAVAKARVASVGGDAYGLTLKLLTMSVLASGGVMAACHKFVQDKVMTDPACVDLSAVKKAKTKTKMSVGDSAKFLAGSKYIRDLATLVISYGMAINIVEVTWKGRLRQAFPDATAYSAFLGTFSSATGAATIAMMLAGRTIFNKFGWGVAAQITPAVLMATGIGFFGLILAPGPFRPIAAALGTTPLMLAVLVGAVQNIMTKSSKYSLFDPCKEMAFIPLSPEEKTKGKAAIDVIGNPLGKSGGSMIQQILLLSLGSLAAATPYLAAILGVVVVAWLRAARSLSGQFEGAMAKEQGASSASSTAPVTPA